jgi:hypothetical protein
MRYLFTLCNVCMCVWFFFTCIRLEQHGYTLYLFSELSFVLAGMMYGGDKHTYNNNVSSQYLFFFFCVIHRGTKIEIKSHKVLCAQHIVANVRADGYVRG